MQRCRNPIHIHLPEAVVVVRLAGIPTAGKWVNETVHTSASIGWLSLATEAIASDKVCPGQFNLYERCLKNGIVSKKRSPNP